MPTLQQANSITAPLRGSTKTASSSPVPAVDKRRAVICDWCDKIYIERLDHINSSPRAYYCSMTCEEGAKDEARARAGEFGPREYPHIVEPWER